jgi:hypothetical protein
MREISIANLFYFEKGDPIVSIGAYCLMSNHFHILVREILEGGTSLFMRKILTAYSMYFNTRFTRRGRLFESTYRARHIENDTHLKYVFSYIHLNPVDMVLHDWKTRALAAKELLTASEFLDKYPYSSRHEYRSVSRDESRILDKRAFPDYFEGEYLKEEQGWLNHNTKDNPLCVYEIGW